MDEFRLDENLKPHFKKPWRPGDPDPDAAGNLNEFMTVIPPDKISAKLTSNWIVKGLIPKTGIGAIYGPSGCGKTFVALEIGMAIARGVPGATAGRSAPRCSTYRRTAAEWLGTALLRTSSAMDAGTTTACF